MVHNDMQGCGPAQGGVGGTDHILPGEEIKGISRTNQALNYLKGEV